MEIDELLTRFPKKRPILDDDVAKIYQIEYKKNRNGETRASSLAQKLEGWMHNNVAKSFNPNTSDVCDTLEIGAGTLNQLPFESLSGDYDIIEPMVSLYEDSQFFSRLRNCYTDISEIPTSINYNRIISVAVLEHLDDLPTVVKQSIRHLKSDGVFACGIPSEGGFLWGLAWRLTTGLEYRIRTGFNYGKLMQHEHLNEAWEIEKILRYFFKDVSVKRFGLGMHFSLYTFIECTNPIILD
tara:strand:- start:10 stop:729 length:720 start_codon:yes stop_codon:yes gene_type:complete